MHKYVRSLPVVSVLAACALAFLSAPAPMRAQGVPFPGFVGPHSAGSNTFTEVIVANVTCSSSPCTITHTFTSGNAIEIIFSSISNSFITAVSGGGTWTIPAACQETDSSRAISAAYITSNTGVSSLSVSFAAGGGLITYSEFSASPGPISFDGCAVADQTISSSTQNMISPALAGTNDAIFQGLTANQTVNSFTTAYTTSQAGGTFGSVFIFNSATTTAPVANFASPAVAVVDEIAFK